MCCSNGMLHAAKYQINYIFTTVSVTLGIGSGHVDCDNEL